MSRLDSAIRRLCAQRSCLEAALALAPPGDILELGLGNGRTYDHLREIAPDRIIRVIDRQMNAHPDSAPPPEAFLQGEADAMLARLVAEVGPRMALVHYDLGVGLESTDAPLRASLAPLIRRAMHPDGVLVANGPFDGFRSLPLPEDVAPGRYFMLAP